MKEIVDNKKSFCFLANMCRFLQGHSIQIDEADLGIALGYVGFTFSLKSLSTEEVVLGRKDSLEEMFGNVMDILGRQHFDLQDFSEEKMWDINSYLADGPVLVWLDEYYLPNSYYFSKYHFNGVICVEKIGSQKVKIFDRGNDCLSLTDWNVILKKQKKYRVVYWIQAQEDAIVNSTRNMKKGIKRIAYNMLKEDVLQKEGLSGLKAFIRFVDECGDMVLIEAVTFQLKRASGPIDSRKKLALVLERNADIWNCNCLAQHYMKLSDEWEIFSNLLFKYCKTGNKKIKERIMIRLGYIFQLEEAGSNSLEILVNTL